MSNDSTRPIEMLAGGADRIVTLLGIERAPLEDQTILVMRFSDIVMKRLLLRVPDERIEDVRLALTGDGGGMERFIEVLERSVPDFERCVREEMDKTVADLAG